MRMFKSHLHIIGAFATILLTASLATAEDWPERIRQLERADAKTRRENLPVAYHNYGVELLRAGQLEKATKQLEKAARLAPNEEYIKQQLANAYLHRAMSVFRDRKKQDHQHRTARMFAEKSLRHDRNSVDAYLLLGEIAYDNQNLRSAKMNWTRAKLIEPKNATALTKLARLKRESAVEQEFKRESHAFFDVRYQKGIDSKKATKLRSTLENARREIGKEFGYVPQRKLVVLVYSEKGFRRIREGRGLFVGGCVLRREDSSTIADLEGGTCATQADALSRIHARDRPRPRQWTLPTLAK